jgi:predicted component of viral defense system (DUF524 family)
MEPRPTGERFWCRQVSWRETVAGYRVCLDLYSLSWPGGLESSYLFGPVEVSGVALAPQQSPRRGLLFDAARRVVMLSEEEEVQVVAFVETSQGQAPAPLFWEALRAAGHCVEDPSSRASPWARRARLRFRGALGQAALDIAGRGRALLRVALEVFSEKLRPHDELPWLLADLARVATSLALRPSGAVSLWLSRGRGDASPLERLVLLAAILSPPWLPRALARVEAAPTRGIAREVTLLRPETLRLFRPDELARALAQSAPLHPQTRALARSGLAARRVSTEDTPENRLVAEALRRTRDESRALGAFLRDAELRPLVQSLIQSARRLSLPPWMADLPAPTPAQRAAPPLVARRRAGYREAVLAGRLLGRGLAPGKGNPTLYAPGQAAAYLYERWCLLVLARVLGRLSGRRVELALWLGEGGVLRPKAGRVWRVAPGIALGYQVEFAAGKRSYSVELRPDFYLEFFGARLVFDAKYRIDGAHEKPRHEDLLTAHAYKDALSVEGSFLLYPGEGAPQLFRAPGGGALAAVGAFPLRPGPWGAAQGEDALLAFLREHSHPIGAPLSPSRKAAEVATKAAEPRAEYGPERVSRGEPQAPSFAPSPPAYAPVGEAKDHPKPRDS